MSGYVHSNKNHVHTNKNLFFSDLFIYSDEYLYLKFLVIILMAESFLIEIQIGKYLPVGTAFFFLS